MRLKLFTAVCAVTLSSHVATAQNAPASSEQDEPSQASDAKPETNVLVIPAPISRRSLWATVERVRTVDIPQWAKDEGHNGRARYSATVGANGELIALELVQSSMSSAIDEAVKARAQTLSYEAATDKEGNPVEGKVNVWMEYARFDKDSPDGGIDTYTCGEMVREFDWFSVANSEREKVFVPQLSYIVLGSLVRMENGENVDAATMDSDIDARLAMWAELVEQCRKDPESLLLDEVDHPEMYRKQVDSR